MLLEMMLHQGSLHRKNMHGRFAEKIVHCFRLNVWWIVETSMVFLLFLQLYLEPPHSSIEESIKLITKFQHMLECWCWWGTDPSKMTKVDREIQGERCLCPHSDRIYMAQKISVVRVDLIE